MVWERREGLRLVSTVSVAVWMSQSAQYEELDDEDGWYPVPSGNTLYLSRECGWFLVVSDEFPEL